MAASSFSGVTPAERSALAASPPSVASASSSRSVVTKASPAALDLSSATASTRARSGFM